MFLVGQFLVGQHGWTWFTPLENGGGAVSVYEYSRGDKYLKVASE